jgi:hypothetical protein
MKSTYTTSKTIGFILLLIGAVGLGISLYSSPSCFQIDTVVLIIAAVLSYMFFDVMWGTCVSIEDKFVIRTDNFFMKKRIAISDIDTVRYQPTYGVGKEASSVYIFRKDEDTAVFTMTNLWFGEKKLSQFARELRKMNPSITFDDEAQALVKKYEQSGSCTTE